MRGFPQGHLQYRRGDRRTLLRQQDLQVIGFILSAILLNEGNAVSVIAFASLLLVCIGIYIANGENKKEA